MHRILWRWAEDRRITLEHEGIHTIETRLIEGVPKPAASVYHESRDRLGWIVAWESGEMDVEVLDIASENQVYFRSHIIDTDTDLDRLLEGYLECLRGE